MDEAMTKLIFEKLKCERAQIGLEVERVWDPLNLIKMPPSSTIRSPIFTLAHVVVMSEKVKY